MRGLSGKTAIVAGGAGGIGSAICERFAAEGVSVICADFSERRGNEVAARLGARGVAVRFAKLDVGDPASWQQLLRGQHRIDILVSAAYFARGGTIEALSDTDWHANFRVTLDGVFFGMRACLELMTAGGAIVNVASVAGLLGMPVNAGYGAAKSAVAGLTRTVAVSTAGRGIRVNSVSPGFITTRALDGLGELMAASHGSADNARRALLTGIPMDKFGQPSDIAGAVAFLASDDAAYITGADLIVDGGYTVV